MLKGVWSSAVFCKLISARKRLSRSLLNFHRRYNLFFYFYLASACYLVFFWINSFIPGVSPGIADAAISPSSYYVSVSSGGDINFKIQSTPDGTLMVDKDTVNVKTNATVGYRLFLSTNSADPAAGSRLAKDYSPSSRQFISPAVGSFAAPAPLTANTWGYAVPRGASSIGSHFTSDYDSIIPLPDSKWSKVPTILSPQIIDYTNSATESAGRDLDVYYGVNVNTALDSGLYGATILYTAIIDATDQSKNEATVSPKLSTKPAGGELLTVTTSLKSGLTKISDLISASDISAYFWSDSESAVPGPDNSCQDIAINKSYPVLRFTCVAPARPLGKHQLVISIPKFSFVYTIRDFIYSSPINGFPDHLSYLQQMTPEICAAVTTPSPTDIASYQVPEKTLIDLRDGNSYMIRKLADGRCWMTQNLRLKLRKGHPLTISDTDINSGSSWKPPYSTESFSSTDGQTAPSDWNSDAFGSKASRSIYNESSYQTDGVYYSHNAASAGSGSNINTDGYSTHNSICPKGWQLPSSSHIPGRGDFWLLANIYRGVNHWSSDQRTLSSAPFLTSDPANFGLHGSYASRLIDGKYQLESVGVRGGFWSSTVKSGSQAYALSQNPSALTGIPSGETSPYSLDSRSLGLPVRCVARDRSVTFDNITVMQEITPKLCARQSDHAATSLTDIRDGNVYRVVKLKDGNCWMSQNLRLKLNSSAQLTNTTTDLNTVSAWRPDRSTEVFGRTSEGISGSNWHAFRTENYRKTTLSGYDQATESTHGVYYAHGAAVAGGSQRIDSSGKVIADSICPRGWRLPRANDRNSYTSEFARLLRSYLGSAEFTDLKGLAFRGGNALASSPFGVLYSGRYQGDKLIDFGQTYYNWSSTLGTYGEARSFAYRSDYVETAADAAMDSGYPIRCIVSASEAQEFDGITTMQEMTPAICAKQPVGASIVLTDVRDNKRYRVSKLKDRNCWMTQNLALEFTADTAISALDSDLPVTSYAKDGTNAPIYHRFTPDLNTRYQDGERWNRNCDMLPQSDCVDDRNADRSYKPSANYPGNDLGDYGVFYNWYSAVAGTADLKNHYPEQKAPGSICPRGWQLPVDGNINTDKSYARLIYFYYGDLVDSNGSNGSVGTKYPLLSSPLSFILSGSYEHENGRHYFYDISGSLWTANALNRHSAYALKFGRTGIDSRKSESRHNGYAVRCVARSDTIETISTMQEITPEICAASSIHATARLFDARDINTYGVAKLKDGNCWMTDNLDLELKTDQVFGSRQTDLPAGKTFSPNLSTTVTTTPWNQDCGSDLKLDDTCVYEKTHSRSYKVPSNASGYPDKPYGTLYNWYAATAGTIHSGALNGSFTSSQSICPRGWTLPTGGDYTVNRSFPKLVRSYYPQLNISDGTINGSDISRELLEKPHLNFTRSGYIENVSGEYLSANSGGIFWTNSLRESSIARTLYFDRNYISSESGTYRYNGASLRCVAR